MAELVPLFLLALGLALWMATQGRDSENRSHPAPRSARRPASAARSSPKSGGKDIAPKATVDLSRFQQAPPGARPDISAAPEVLEEVRSHVHHVTDHLRSRRAILEMLSSPTYEPKKVTELILADEALVARVLRTVNSPYYGFRHAVGSVFRAILLLGHVEVCHIIYRASVADARNHTSSADEALIDALWQHCFSASRIAYSFGKALSLKESDQIATAALLHDIGKLVLTNVRPALARELYLPVRFGTRDDLQREEDEFGISHTALGAEVARMWGLPDATVAAIRHHHAPSYVDPEMFDRHEAFIAAVHISDVLSHGIVPPLKGDASPIYTPLDGWLRILGVRSLEKITSKRPVMCTLQRLMETRESEPAEPDGESSIHPSRAQAATHSLES